MQTAHTTDLKRQFKQLVPLGIVAESFHRLVGLAAPKQHTLPAHTKTTSQRLLQNPTLAAPLAAEQGIGTFTRGDALFQRREFSELRGQTPLDICRAPAVSAAPADFHP